MLMSTNPSSAHPEAFEALFDILKQFRAANCAIVSSCAFLSYDVLLTLRHEITHIWGARWSFPKFAYLIVRYYGIAHLMGIAAISVKTNNSLETCRLYYYLLTFGGTIFFVTIGNIVLILRLNALYEGNRKILIALVFLGVAQFATDLYMTIRTACAVIEELIPAPMPSWPGCLSTTTIAGFAMFSLIPTLIVATTFFGMMLYNFVRVALANEKFGKRAFKEVTRFSPFLVAFVRDGTAFYFILMVNVIVTLVLISLIGGPSSLGCDAWFVATYSFATSRLILNLRIAAAKEAKGKSTSWFETLSVRIPFDIDEVTEVTEEWIDDGTKRETT